MWGSRLLNTGSSFPEPFFFMSPDTNSPGSDRIKHAHCRGCSFAIFILLFLRKALQLLLSLLLCPLLFPYRTQIHH